MANFLAILIIPSVKVSSVRAPLKMINFTFFSFIINLSFRHFKYALCGDWQGMADDVHICDLFQVTMGEFGQTIVNIESPFTFR